CAAGRNSAVRKVVSGRRPQATPCAEFVRLPGSALAAVCRADDLGETRSSQAKKARQVRAAGLELAAGDRGVDGGHEARGRLNTAGPLERVGVLLGRQVTAGPPCPR